MRRGVSATLAPDTGSTVQPIKSIYYLHVLILAYHRVQPEPEKTLSASTHSFERQLRWLLATGWEPAVLDDARRRFAETFAAGYQANVLHAVPVLLKLGIPASILSPPATSTSKCSTGVATECRWTDRDGFPLRRSDLVELVRMGFEVGSHTVTHPHLTRMCDEAIRAELRESRFSQRVLDANRSASAEVAFQPPLSRYLRA